MRMLVALVAFVFVSGLAFAKPQQKSYEVTQLDVAAQSVLVVKSKGESKKLPAAIKAALNKVEAYMKSKGIAAIGLPLTKTLVYKQGEIEFQSGFPVAKGQKAEGEIEIIELPAGKAVKTVHTGPSDQTPRAYEALHQWMIPNKKKPAGQPWEVYAGADKLEVFYPIQDKK